MCEEADKPLEDSETGSGQDHAGVEDGPSRNAAAQHKGAAPGGAGQRVPRALMDDVATEEAASTSAQGHDEQPEPSLEITTESVVEAVLFATDSPLPAAKIAQILGVGDARTVKKQITALNAKYAETVASFRIEEVAGGFQMLTLPAYNNWVSKLRSIRRETKLSPAALETLAVVAYKQPALRADIEAVRGVAVGDVLNRLREMGLIKVVGRAEVIGRPMLYGTTRKFLEVFGLASLEDLPKVDALSLPPQQQPATESTSDPQRSRATAAPMDHPSQTEQNDV
jgi:segregation and condensation protein B